MSLRKPIALSLAAHLIVLGSVWFYPRNSDFTDQVESLPMEIFENLKDQMPLKQLTQKIKQKILKPEITKSTDSATSEKKIDKDNLQLNNESNDQSSSDVVEGSQVTVRAKLLSDHKVAYPDEAKQKSVEGPVIMDLVIDRQGRVVDAKIIKGPGFGLNEAALAATSKFVFSPARIGDQAVSVRIRYTYRFVLDD